MSPRVPFVPPETVDKLVYAYEQGTPLGTLAKEFGLGRITTRKKLAERGVEIRRRDGRLTREQRAEIVARYAKGGVAMAALGKQYGVSGAAVFMLVHGRKSMNHPQPKGAAAHGEDNASA